MESYSNYNFQQIKIPSSNYRLYENTINEIHSKFNNQSNNFPNNFTSYEINSYIHNPTEINFTSNNLYSIHTPDIPNTSYPLENYYINNDRNIIKKIPEDKNSYIDKMPKDNLKGKRESLKQKNNFNKINRIKILLNDYEIKEKKEKKINKEKQPKDNYKKYLNDIESGQNKIKKRNLNIKINDNNSKDINNNIQYQQNYLRTNEYKSNDYNQKRASKRNSIKTIERIKKNNLISINDVLLNNKKNNTKSNNINMQKSPNGKSPKTNKLKKENKELDKNYSTNEINNIKQKQKSDSNFASLINKKKLKMFSSFKQLSNTKINPEENNNGPLKPERLTISKNILAKKNKTIKLKNNLGRLYSPQLTSPNQMRNKTELIIKRTKQIAKKKNTNTNINKQLKRNISYNMNTSTASNTKKKFSTNTYLTERKNGNLSNRNVLSKKRNTNIKSNNGGKIIRKQLSLRNSKQTNGEEIHNNLYNRNTTRFSRKKIIYSRGKNSKEKNEVIVNQKKNLFTFMKKTHKKESYHSHEILSEDKFDMHNKSYKGFSSLKKLEEIKKKYKFFPHNKEKKILLKEKNIDYIEESNIFSKLINSMDLNKSNEVRNLNLTEEFLPQKTEKQEVEKYEVKIIENEEDNEEEKNEENDKDNDKLNRKSFILDLNNVIPINEKQLRDTMNKPRLTNTNINMDLK